MKFYQLCEDLKGAEVTFDCAVRSLEAGRAMAAKGPVRPGSIQEAEADLQGATASYTAAKSALLQALQADQ